MAMKVLVVEDSETQCDIWDIQLSMLLSKLKLNEVVTLMQATTIEEAVALFRANKADLSAIVMDGCVPGNNINTEPLTKMIRAEGFKGPMIAVSGVPWFQDRLVKAGCNTKCSKYQVVQRILEVLGVLSA